MLSKQDLQQIQTIVISTAELIFDTKIKPRFDELEQRIKYLPTREEYLAEADKIYGEIRNMR